MSEKKSSNAFNKNSEVRKQRRMKVLVVLLLLFLIMVVGGIAVLRRPEFQIVDTTVSGTKSLDQAEVRAFTERYLSDSYAMIIPRSNALLLSKSNLEQFLKSSLPTIHDVHVSFLERNHLLVTLTEKKPEFVWCEPNHCYFADRSGVLYEESPTFSDGVFVIFTGGSLAKSDARIGQRVAPEDIFHQYRSLIEQLKDYPIHVIGVDIREGGDIAVRINQIKATSVNPKATLLVSEATMDGALQLLTVLLADRTFLMALQAKADQLEYVDVRIPGKVYYKFTNGAQVAGEAPDPVH